MLNTLGAPRASSKLRRGRVQAVEGDPGPSPLPLTRATLVRPRPFEDRASADDWLEQVCADRDLWTRLAHEAADQLNRLLHTHRTATGDPYLADVDPGRAVAVRFGFGTGDEVADGRWIRANELGESERRKLVTRDLEALRPQERIAAVLGGRDAVGVHEDLIVRARGDLDAGRVASAALSLHAGLEAWIAVEFRGDPGALRDPIRMASEAHATVLDGDEPDPVAVALALRTAEAEMRRRALR